MASKDVLHAASNCMEFFNANGPQGIEAVQKAQPGVSLFIDLKYHDIPNTVAVL